MYNIIAAAFGILFFMKVWIKLIGLKSVTATPLIIVENKNTFKILTYNCYLRSCAVVSSCIFDYKNERLDEIIDCVLPNYDIVCLQEVFASMSFRTSRLVNRARELGFKYCVVPKAPAFFSRKLIDSGLVILSKHPILEYHCISFEHPGVFSDQLADKGFQYAKINVYGRIIHVINTHIQSDYEIHDKIAYDVKLRQLKQIKRFTDNNRDNDIYLCGDLNCNSIHIHKFKPTTSESELYTDMTWMFSLRSNGSDLLYDTVHPTTMEKYGYHIGQRPATSYSTYDVRGKEIDTVYREKDDPYLIQNQYVCLPRSVDYIILLHNLRQTNPVRCIKCKTKNFEISNKKNSKYLSDHSAVYAKMKFIDAPNNYIK